jgi:NADH:ubiquinone oxidoreductase subunit 6 (subunit J)
MMMLNIKLAELKDESLHFVPVAILFTSAFVLELLALFRLDFVPLIISNNSNVNFLSDFISVSSSSGDPSI